MSRWRKWCGPKSRMRRCFLWFLRELSNFRQLIPTQEGSMGWDNQTFLSLGQSRTANGLAFDLTWGAREVVCGHDFRVQLRELSNFHQLIPTQKGSIGLDSNTFRTSGQSRTAGGQAFASRPSPLARGLHVLWSVSGPNRLQ